MREPRKPVRPERQAMHADLKGCVFDVQHYSIHDGPGIRTLVHLKGCPPRCTWCSNPESQARGPEFGWRSGRCIRCGQCREVCPEGCMRIRDDAVHVDRTRCTQCGKCAEACPGNALVVFGRRMTAGEVVEEVPKDEGWSMKYFMRRRGRPRGRGALPAAGVPWG